MVFTIAQGLGDCAARKADPTQPTAIPLPIFTFELTSEETVEPLVAYKGGKHQTKKNLETSSTVSLTLSTEVPTWQMISVARGELERSISSMIVPRVVVGIVGAGGVTTGLTDIVSGNIATLAVTLEDDGGIPMTKISSGSPTALEVLPAAGQLTFDASQAGKTYYMVVDVSRSGKGFGGAGVTPLGQLEFVGEVRNDDGSDNGFIWIPKIELASKAPITFNGDKFTVEMEFSCLAYSNWDVPYLLLHDLT